MAAPTMGGDAVGAGMAAIFDEFKIKRCEGLGVKREAWERNFFAMV